MIDEGTKEAIEGAYITIEGTLLGALSNENGRFSIPRPTTGAVTKIIVSYVGYERKEIIVQPGTSDLRISLKDQAVNTNDVIVSASRISERILESPVTVEKLDLRSIKELPMLNVYDAVATMKGVDQMSASLGFRALNTRGFSAMSNPRFVHRVDGMDLQAPGLNISVNVLNGVTDLDAASIELIPGAASALYGSNVFNGMMEVGTKNPFQYTGLSVSFKTGANHLDGVDHSVAPIYDFCARYAKNFNDKVAFKVNFSYFKATDWYATDYNDDTDYSGSDNLKKYSRGPGNPGYSGGNIYGDEVKNLFTPEYKLGSTPFLNENLLVARTGYKETDLANYNTYNIKGDFGVHWKVNKEMELSLTSRIAGGTTVYQSVNRYSLVDFLLNITKLELTGKNYFVRGYVSYEDAGDTYDTRFTGINMNNYYKPHDAWMSQYLLAYSPVSNPILNSILKSAGRPEILPGNDQDARNFAESDNRALFPGLYQALRSQGMDSLTAMGTAQAMTAGSARPLPGTPEFEAAKKAITSSPIINSGSKFIDKTMFYHLEGQVDLGKYFNNVVECQVGMNYRMYAPNSRGTLFTDTAGKSIYVHEAGAFVQVTKRFFEKKLRITLSGRVDKNQNFDFIGSPRVAAVYTFGERRNHNIRASFQTGFRMPTLQDQYIGVNVGSYKYISGLDEAFKSYNLIIDQGEKKNVNNSYTESSIYKFLFSGDSTQLVRSDLKKVRPESARCMEVGYKVNINDNILLDISGYLNRYNNFISYQSTIGPNLSDPGEAGNVLTTNDIKLRKFTAYQRATNYSDDVYTCGASFGFQWSISSKFSLYGNYTYSKMLANDSLAYGSYRIGFNTPNHKTNVTLAARNLFKNWGFSLNHRWINSTFFVESIIIGTIPSYNLIDAQITYSVPKYKAVLKLGGTNILNNRHLESVIGPRIGGLLYFQIVFEDLLK